MTLTVLSLGSRGSLSREESSRELSKLLLKLLSLSRKALLVLVSNLCFSSVFLLFLSTFSTVLLASIKSASLFSLNILRFVKASDPITVFDLVVLKILRLALVLLELSIDLCVPDF